MTRAAECPPVHRCAPLPKSFQEAFIKILSSFTLFHVIPSPVGIFSGLVAVYGFVISRTLGGWTSIFLRSTVLTSVAGYFFPFHQLLQSLLLAAISLVVLAFAIYACIPDARLLGEQELSWRNSPQHKLSAEPGITHKSRNTLLALVAQEEN